MNKITQIFFFCFMLFLLQSRNSVCAQFSIGNPTLLFGQICANSEFNTFKVSFTFSPSASLSPTNQFIVELSDANGFFSNPTVLATTNPGEVTTSPATISFSVPTNTAGENYKLRIKSTAPLASSGNSLAFSAYYKAQDSPFTINNFNATATYCSGGSYTLTIDNPGTGTNDSPLKYPSLTYNWYKEATPNPILVATTQSLTVTQPGTYYAETNYGSCTSDSYSNRVTVSEATSNSNTTITSSLGNPFCSNQGSTTLTTVSGNSYQWYKDNKIISGATNQSYITNQPGLYSVTVNYGGCVANASIDLKTDSFTNSINVPATNYIESGETLSVSVTSSASNPEYKWYLNNNLIPNVNGSSYDVITIGNYKVVVSQTSDCFSSEELTFTVQDLINSNATEIPNLISPNNDGVNDTWIIPQEYTGGTETEVLLISSNGEIVLKTNNYKNNWPENITDFKNVNPIYYYIITTKGGQTKKGSITIIK